jgi:hypothetical protein
LDWTVPIESVIINVSSDGINFNNKYCYQGGLKSKENCIIDKTLFKNSRILNPKEGITIALSFGKGEVVKNELWKLNRKGWIVTILGSIILFFSTIFILGINYLNKYKPNKPIIPIYKPYNNYHPAITGYLIDKKLDSRDLTAGILSLAQKGYIKIERIEKQLVLFGSSADYIFRLKKSFQEITDDLDKFFVKLIFSKNKFNIDEIIQKINIENITSSFDYKNTPEQDLLMEVKLSNLIIRSSDIFEKRQEIDKWLKEYSKKNNFIESLDFYKHILLVLLVPFIIFFYQDLAHTYLFPILLFILIIFNTIFLFISRRYTKKGW